MDFAREACSREEYRDWFLISIVDGPTALTKKEKAVRLVWFCLGLDKTLKDDKRDHEALLRHHFRQYDLIIEKKSGRWIILVTLPQLPTQIPHVQVVLKSAKRTHDKM